MTGTPSFHDHNNRAAPLPMAPRCASSRILHATPRAVIRPKSASVRTPELGVSRGERPPSVRSKPCAPHRIAAASAKGWRPRCPAPKTRLARNHVGFQGLPVRARAMQKARAAYSKFRLISVVCQNCIKSAKARASENIGLQRPISGLPGGSEGKSPPAITL